MEGIVATNRDKTARHQMSNPLQNTLQIATNIPQQRPASTPGEKTKNNKFDMLHKVYTGMTPAI